MTPLDDRLSQAVADLRDDIDGLDAPPFAPQRSLAPTMLVLVLVVAIGIGAFAALANSGENSGMSVATQPAEPEAGGIGPDTPELVSSADADSAGDPGTSDDVERPLASSPLIGRVVMAESGEFLMPLPAGSAWSPDESRLLMYRTGNAEPGHFILDAATGEVEGPVTLPITPADIEQVYWHPADDNLLVYTSDADVMVYDLTTGQSRTVQSFDQCDRVDSGIRPVPPGKDGMFSLLCHAGSEQDLLVYNLITSQVRQATTSGDTAAEPSPSGSSLVRWNGDGSASVLDTELAETGVTLELGDNPFVFVTDNSGREWIAATLFDGLAVGTIVLLPLDGADDPVVVIGPERGDSYPPSGTSISAAASVVAVSIAGDDDGILVGRVVAVDLGAPVAPSFSDLPGAGIDRLSFAHRSTGAHGYWSTPFLSVSPTGRFVAYSTDSGEDRVETFVARVTEPTE